jgi:hypothetical protein
MLFIGSVATKFIDLTWVTYVFKGGGCEEEQGDGTGGALLCGQDPARHPHPAGDKVTQIGTTSGRERKVVIRFLLQPPPPHH